MTAQKFSGLTIGIPKEIMEGERRVAGTPETVKKFSLPGKVIKGRGAGTSFPTRLARSGASAATRRNFCKADIIISKASFNPAKSKPK